MTGKMNMLARIKHIFPYLYYRTYQYVYQKGGEKWNPELRAFGFVCVIKIFIIFFFCMYAYTCCII